MKRKTVFYYSNENLSLTSVTKELLIGGIVLLIVGIFSGFVMSKAIPNNEPELIVQTDTVYQEINPYNLELNDSNLMSEIKRNKIYFPDIVFKQGQVESGNYTSNICKENNNIFGFKVFGSWTGMEMKFKNRNHLVFKHWTDCVKHYKMHQEKNFKDRYYLQYLSNLGYAESPFYIQTLRGR